MTERIERVVIVGAGQAGGEAASRLRQAGFPGAVTLIGEEPLAPYQRPPLSKKYLSGDWGADRLLVKPPETYAEDAVSLRTGTRVAAIDRTGRRVVLADGAVEPYDALILATGAAPRALPVPGAELAGVHLLRTAADVDAIRPGFVPGARLVVIGAGYIGLEGAAVARQLGLEVTVLEAAPRPLARVAHPELSAFFLAAHARRGVHIELGAAVARLNGIGGRVCDVELADGRRFPADLVIVGIGVAPAVALAESAGLSVDNGVLTDANCRTSDPAIFAIGDCARRPAGFCGGESVRLESVHNALESAKIAASAITGAPAPPLEAPWFWSDQYELKLQIAGLFQRADTMVRRGDPDSEAFALFHFAGEELVAVDAVNRPAEYLGGKQLIQRRQTVAPAALEDMSTPMKEIVAGARAVDA